MDRDESTVLLDYPAGPAIARLTLNRPASLNAINTAMILRIEDVLAQLEAEDRVRVVILTGAGERAFCAGADLKERLGMTPEQWRRQHRLIESMAAAIRQLRKPIFSAVNGLAVGGGCEVAMNTDFIIASQNAVFGQPEVKRGIIPGAGGTQFLPRYIPRGMALELLMTGGTIDAQTAARLGLVNRVLPAAELMPAAIETAQAIAANSPTAVRQAKHAAKLGIEAPIEQAMQIEIECYERMVDHPDRYEGVAAFNEKRAPVFRDA